mmetsp:Transcript_49374/g.81999  ORF Transcript_49374/g.81999 Transcript_49374/m.81999 type:complete len:219 (-) Transcript_49374:110-766(-)
MAGWIFRETTTPNARSHGLSSKSREQTQISTSSTLTFRTTIIKLHPGILMLESPGCSCQSAKNLVARTCRRSLWAIAIPLPQTGLRKGPSRVISKQVASRKHTKPKETRATVGWTKFLFLPIGRGRMEPTKARDLVIILQLLWSCICGCNTAASKSQPLRHHARGISCAIATVGIAAAGMKGKRRAYTCVTLDGQLMLNDCAISATAYVLTGRFQYLR